GYHRREAAGTIVIDSDARYLYFVLPGGLAIRYGVTVGEEALAWSGVAKVGRKEEWPAWRPTAEIERRLGHLPDHVSPGRCTSMKATGIRSAASMARTSRNISGRPFRRAASA